MTALDELPIVIDEVIPEAFVSLDEKGTEVTAATATVMTLGTSAEEKPKPAEFHADHPFIFTIIEKRGVRLFFGRTVSPNSVPGYSPIKEPA